MTVTKFPLCKFSVANAGTNTGSNSGKHKKSSFKDSNLGKQDRCGIGYWDHDYVGAGAVDFFNKCV